eukprot:CAMPEP_0168508906 /NCGR_PEP_ID=MMETSP0405-20121227/419_1 /TAXON_ID=498012 /ORGANISM="Trichosphaerium sp, Strain Am-I-7 wt" /LENGTH=663 /DNA_ID=CAMNT_0008526183 /DNA_START=166 /DNA_END=2158 /DNA_ORIENTATION=+
MTGTRTNGIQSSAKTDGMDFLHHYFLKRNKAEGLTKIPEDEQKQFRSSMQLIARMQVKVLFAYHNSNTSVIEHFSDSKQFTLMHDFMSLLADTTGFGWHYLGESYLHLRMYAKAFDCFVKASWDVENGRPELYRFLLDRGYKPRATNISMGKALNIILNHKGTDIIDETLPKHRGVPLRRARYTYLKHYWYEVINLFASAEQYSFAVQAAHRALMATDPKDEVALTQLWTIIFLRQLELGEYDDAYIAINANKAMCAERLRRFLVVMAEKGEWRKMIRYPFLGMEDQVHKELLMRSRNSDVSERPNFYHILYSFHSVRGNYRQAASAMYEYADRCSIETHMLGIESMERQSQGLVSAISALSLARDDFAYVLMRPRDTLIMKRPVSPKRKYYAGKEYMAELDATKFTPGVVVITIDEIRRKQLIVSCSIKLAKKNLKQDEDSPSILGNDNPLHLCDKLLEQGFIDEAFSMGKLFKFNHDEMAKIFVYMTNICLELDGVDLEAIESPWALRLARIYQKPSVVAWMRLRKYLEDYNSQYTNFHYHLVAAKRILTAAPDTRLKPWLMNAFKREGSEDKSHLLISLLIQFESYEEACRLGIYMFQNAREALSDSKTTFISYNVVDNMEKRINTFMRNNTSDQARKDILEKDIWPDYKAARDAYFRSL